MGKCRKRNRPRERADPTTGRPTKVIDPATAALRSHKVLPAVAALRDADAKCRALAGTNIANLVEDEKCRKLLLREGLVGLLTEQTINDSDLDVVCKGWGILRNLALAEQADFCVHLHRQDILTPIGAALSKVRGLAQRPQRPSKAEEALILSIISSLETLLSSLALASEKILDIVASQQGLVDVMTDLLDGFPDDTSSTEAVLYLLYVLTEASEAFCRELVKKGLMEIIHYGSREDLRAALTLGIVNHVEPEMIEAGVASERPQTLQALRRLLTHNTAIHKKTQGTFSNGTTSEASDPSAALEKTLEVIATIASDLQGEGESGEQHDKDEPEEEFEGFPDDRVDEDKTMEGEDTSGKDRMPNVHANTNGHDEGADVNMMDGASEAFQDSETSAGSLSSLEYMLQHLAPLIIDLATPTPETQHTNAIYTKAVVALNNISWTVYTASSSSSVQNLSDSATITLSTLWAPLAQTIWTTTISPILASSTASTSLAAHIASLACAIAKSLSDNIILSEPYEYRRFIALYQASRSLSVSSFSRSATPADQYSDITSLGPATIGVLGALATTMNIERNREIGTFLLSLLLSLPSTPAHDSVETLNAIFEIYADAAYPYDGPVFVEGGFLEQLRGVLPAVRKMAKGVDRRVDPEGRKRADEVVVDLGRFVTYKEGERRGMEG